VVKRGILMTLILLLAAGPAPAQPGPGKVSVSLSSNSISMDENAVLTVSVSGVSDDLQVDLPQTRDGGLQIMPSGRRISMTSINGQTSSSVEQDFRITPLSKGRHLIEPITGTVGGTSFTTRSQRLEVTDYGTGQSSRTSSQSSAGINPANPWQTRNPAFNPWGTTPGASVWPNNPIIPQPREDDVLLEADVQPEVVYKHQPVYYNLRLLTGVRLLSDPRYNPIAPTGFLRVAFDQENGEEQRNGRYYSVSSVKTAYFPLSEGEYTFDPTQVQVQAGMFALPRTLSTDRHTIKVLPLPSEGRPQSFTGAVGQEFEIRANLKSPEIALGGNSELEISVKGDGHLDLVPYPYLPNWPNLEKKQGTSPSTTSVENGAIVSRRTYNFRLKPGREGKYDLSGIALAYFNPAEKRYEVLKTPPLTLTVEPNRNAEAHATGGKATELPEEDRPMAVEGATSGRLPELPRAALGVGSLLLLAGAWLARGGDRLRWKRAARAGRLKPPRRHKSVQGLMASLESLAPGSDSAIRQAHLRARGWSPEAVERLESLRRRAGKAMFGGTAAEAATLEAMDGELAALLKEVKA
jgi:hypothetical protein